MADSSDSIYSDCSSNTASSEYDSDSQDEEAAELERIDAEETEDPGPWAIYPELQLARWEFERVFNTQEEVDNFLKQEDCWSYRSRDILSDGIKTLYRCIKVKRIGKQCSPQLYILHQIILVDDEMVEGDDQNDRNPQQIIEENAAQKEGGNAQPAIQENALENADENAQPINQENAIENAQQVIEDNVFQKTLKA